MEEKDSAISGPNEEFLICFCGKIPSGSVEWYLIDVSVEEACLSEKTESSTRELTPFSVAKHLPSYAALGGLIYSLGGQRRSYGGGDTLLNDVWLLDFKFLEDLKPGSIPPLLPSLSLRDKLKLKLVPGRKPGSGKAPDSDKAQAQAQSPWAVMEPKLAPGLKPDSDKTQAQAQAHRKTESEKFWDDDWGATVLAETAVAMLEEEKLKLVPDSDKAQAQAQSPWAVMEPKLAPELKPDSGKAHGGEYWKPDSDKTQAQAQAHRKTESEKFWDDDWAEDWGAKVVGETDVDMLKEDKLKLVPDSDMLKEDWAYFDSGFDSGGWKTSPPTALSDKNWKPGLRMNFARCNPHTMVVDHKLYVLGGFQPNQNQADGWIEVFDPEKKKWESLPSPPDQIHSSIMISGLLKSKSKKEIIIAKQRWDCHPLLFYSYNITTRCWDTLVPPKSELSVHSNVERAVILPPNIGRAVTVGNTLYWISTEEDNHECTIRAYDLDRNMWFEDHLNTATIFGRREYFSSIYSRGPGFLHLVDQKFCLLLQSTVTKKDPQSSIQYLYCVIVDISPIYDHEHEDWGKFELRTVSTQKYSMDHYIDFLDCMLLPGD